jgi:hypothetical protein
MFGITYRKANPTDYVLHFSQGRLMREGAGLSFFYFAPSATIVSVPVASANIPFVSMSRRWIFRRSPCRAR